MSIKNLFNVSNPVSSTNLEDKFKEVESAANVEQQLIKKDRFIPSIDYTSASNFAFFGSAEEYYKQSMNYIATSYPYDGSKKEITEFLNNSSYIDLYVFENIYPRHNGYVKVSSAGWGSRVGSKVFGLGKPSTLEYIYVKGGPHTASTGMENYPLAQTFDYSNKYETNVYGTASVLSEGRVGTRESNLKCDFDNGVTVEFWLKKDGFDSTKTETEIVFDLWNGEASSSLSCGRLIIGVADNSGDPDECLAFTIQSGSNIANQNIPGFPYATITDGNWHHYAVVAKNVGTDLSVKFYLDGSKVFESPASFLPVFGEITGSLNATIGALQAGPPVTAFHGINGLGYGKLSGSIDEFRFWKAARDQEQIVDNRWVQVGGGTNTDISNTELGVYFKFNEGITGTSSYDSVVLDYSGRISNGVWTGYPGSSARSTGSAMVESGLADFEYKDPVIYEFHPNFRSAYDALVTSGSAHDSENSSMLYRTIPAWIQEEDEVGNLQLKNLVQIISSVFDTLYLQIQQYNTIKDNTYGVNTPLSESILGLKPFPYNDRLLESYGLTTNEMFSNQKLLEFIQNRSKETQFDFDLTEVKNEIYKNIYNNLIYIYKSKGTEKSIRNLLRSIGINEEIVKLNAYSRNSEYTLTNTYSDDTFSKKYINFYDPDHFSATVFQSASSNPNTNGRTYVSGSPNESFAFTSEVNVIFPKKFEPTGGRHFDTAFTQSSVFGIHIVSGSSITWPSPASSDPNFELYAVRPDKDSNQAYFMLKDRAGTFQITSSVYKEVYENSEWTFAVRVYNNRWPYASSEVAGSAVTDFTIDFVGYNTEGSFVRNNFALSSSLVSASGSALITSNKRYYGGAHRTNFTGSVQYESDIKLGYIRHFETYLDNDTVKMHSIDRNNFGVKNPQQHEFLFYGPDALNSSYVPRILMNDLNIDFEMVTGSDASGKFLVVDYSSGSVDLANRYPTIGTTINTQHEFTGYGFPASTTDVVSREILIGASLNMPESVNSSDLVNVLERDDELFTRDNAVSDMIFSIEKSYYATVSKEMLEFFGGVVAFNNLIGDVSEKYKSEYSRMEFLRSNFFEKITSTASIERFYSYYKWIDDSVSTFIKQLIPASANFESNVRDMIESHILERNKIRHAYPFLDYYGNARFADPGVEGSIKGALQLNRDWKFTSPPFVSGALSTDQRYNPAWWKNYHTKTGTLAPSGNAVVNQSRNRFMTVINQHTSQDYKNLRDSDGNRYKSLIDNTPGLPETVSLSVEDTKNSDQQYTSGITSRFNKTLRTFKNLISKFTDDEIPTIHVSASTENILIKDDLEIRRNIKRKHIVEGYEIDGVSAEKNDIFYSTNAERVLPLTFLSKSVDTGYAQYVNTAEVNNIHSDSIHNDLSIPMQGTFAETYVGGWQHRHQKFNSEASTVRTEAFKIIPTATGFDIKGPQARASGVSSPNNNLPYSIWTRDDGIKRPFNIKNIKSSSFGPGTYSREFDIVMSDSRVGNNRAFVKSGGFSTGSTTSTFVFDLADYPRPDHSIVSGTIYSNKYSGSTSQIIVSRFSAPGGPEVAADSNGGPGLDYQAGEYSPYNNLNYRNLSTRIPLRKFLSERSERFGLRYGVTPVVENYDRDASFHKHHRNGTYIITQNSKQDFSLQNSSSLKIRYDNAYVSTTLPASEYGYSWINQGLDWRATPIVGYQTKTGLTTISGATGLYDELVFYSASDLATFTGSAGISYFAAPYDLVADYATGRIDFLGLNTSVVDTFKPNEVRSGVEQVNTLQALSNNQTSYDVADYINGRHTFFPEAGRVVVLNAVLNNRNGAFGYTTFRQIRTGENKLVRFYKNSNTYINENSAEPRAVLISGSVNSSYVVVDKYGVKSTLVQAPVSSRYKAAQFVLASQKSPGFRKTIVEADYGNTISYFYDDSFTRNLNIANTKPSPAKKVIDFYKSSDRVGALQLKYTEVVYPSEQNIYLQNIRGRSRYLNNFWKDIASDRTSKGQTLKNESIGNIGSGYERSSWDLDEFPAFSTTNFENYPSPGVDPRSTQYYKPPGILQNVTTFNKYYYYKESGNYFSGNASPANFDVQPTYARPHFEYNIRSVVAPQGMDIYITFNGSPNTNVKNINISTYLTNSFVGSGYAKWEITRNYGKYIYSTSSAVTSLGFVTSSEEINPFYDNYQEYFEDVRVQSKDMSILPEFRISNFTDKLVNPQQTSPSEIPDFLEIGQVAKVNDSTIPDNSSADRFYEVFTNSDFMKYFEVVTDQNKNFLEPDVLSLTFKAVKKFVPYDGFYPSERTAQIAKRFFEDYTNTITVSGASSYVGDQNRFRPTMQSLFAPGLLFNTIKSGIAVDYPVFTSSYTTGSRYVFSGSSIAFKALTSTELSTKTKRLPFEAIYEPNKYLNGLKIVDNEPLDESSIIEGNSRLENTVSINTNTSGYIYMINNFLAESTNLFLSNKKPTQIISDSVENFKPVQPGQPYGMRIKMYRSMNRPKETSGSWGNYPVPQNTCDTGSQSVYYIYLNEMLFNGADAWGYEAYTLGSPRPGLPGIVRYKNSGKVFRTPPNLNISSLTASITLSGTLGQYVITGTASPFGLNVGFGFSHNTDTTFEIDSDAFDGLSAGERSALRQTQKYDNVGAVDPIYTLLGYYDAEQRTVDNAKNTVNAIVNAINSGSSANEFAAIYDGVKQIRNVDDSYFTYTETGKQTYYTNASVGDIAYQSFDGGAIAGGDAAYYSTRYHVIKVINKDFNPNAKIALSTSLAPSTEEWENSIITKFMAIGPSKEFFEQNDFANFVVTSSFTGLFAGCPEETLTMYSRPTAFGPPTTAQPSTAAQYSASYDSANGYNFAYTPPYYHGEAWMDIIYIPNGESGSLVQSLSNFELSPPRAAKPKLTSEQPGSYNIFNFPQVTGSEKLPDGTYTNLLRFDYTANADGPTTFKQALNAISMQLSGSIMPFETYYDENGKERWAIKTKYETPVLNFVHLTGSNLVTYPSGPPSASVPRGMWHQFGRIPLNDEGIYLKVEDIPDNWQDNTSIGLLNQSKYRGYRVGSYPVKSLIDICGFSTKPEKIGSLAVERTVKEAVVAIPFVEYEGSRNFFTLNPEMVSKYVGIVNDIERSIGRILSIEDFKKKAEQYKIRMPNSNTKLIDEMINDNTVADLIVKMKIYVLPPNFDFLNFDAKPVSMYVFEFEYKLDQDDLSSIWQNLPPTNSRQMEIVSTTISHPLLSNELLGDWTKQTGDLPIPTSIPPETQWMVFKVKQRALKDYKKLLNESPGKPATSRILTDYEEKISFNWPYDNFSFIEMAKMEASVILTPERTRVDDGGAGERLNRSNITLISGLASDSDTDPAINDKIAKIVSNRIEAKDNIKPIKEQIETVEDKKKRRKTTKTQKTSRQDREMVLVPKEAAIEAGLIKDSKSRSVVKTNPGRFTNLRGSVPTSANSENQAVFNTDLTTNKDVNR